MNRSVLTIEANAIDSVDGLSYKKKPLALVLSDKETYHFMPKILIKLAVKFSQYVFFFSR